MHYDPQLLQWCGLTRDQLPELVPSASVIGEILPGVAEEWGLAAGTKVVLSGLGGDELFGSYPSFTDVPRWQRWARRLTRIPSMSMLWPALTAGAPLLRIPAFSAATCASVSPSQRVCSSAMGATAQASGSTTLVASSRPPSPTSTTAQLKDFAGGNLNGTLQGYDAGNGTLTVTVKEDAQVVDKTLTLAKGAKVEGNLVQGARVAVRLSVDDKGVAVAVLVVDDK